MGRTIIMFPSIGPELAKALARHLDIEHPPEPPALKTEVILQLHELRALEVTRRAERQRLDEARNVRKSKIVQRLEKISKALRSLPERLRQEMEDDDLSGERLADQCDEFVRAIQKFLETRVTEWAPSRDGKTFLPVQFQRRRGRPAKTGNAEHVVKGFQLIHKRHRRVGSKLSAFLIDVQAAIATDHGWLLPVTAKKAGPHARAKGKRLKKVPIEQEIKNWVHVEGAPHVELREKK